MRHPVSRRKGAIGSNRVMSLGGSQRPLSGQRKSCCALPETVSPREESMPAERFDFPNAQGQKLAALLDRPDGEPRAYALFAHCFRSEERRVGKEGRSR